MPALVPGLDDHVEAELQRLRDELRIAIAESGYTLEQVASLAGIARTALRGMLVGEVASKADTLIRIAFVVGASIDVTRAGVGGERPFEVVPAASSSRSPASRSKTAGRLSAGTTADMPATKRKRTKKTAADQRRKSGRRKSDIVCFARSPLHLRKHTRGTRCGGQNAAIVTTSHAVLSTARSSSIRSACGLPSGRHGCTPRARWVESDLRYVRSAA